MAQRIPNGFEPAVGKDPAEDYIGPFYMNVTGREPVAGLLVEDHHCNSMGTVHGGVLMVFADFAFCEIGLFGSEDDHIMTVSMTTEFIRGARGGVWLESRAELTRRTRSLVFLQGQICHEDQVLLNYSGVGKRIQD
jgi:uncharacterized protein (TIGR00369 family)